MRIPRKYIGLLAVIILFALIWSRLRIAIVIPLSLGQAILLFAVLAFVIFLAIDHLINRS
ncbi:MAG: hypothetical protein KC423_28670 [Anaerolineales bacterium]|nr:hypothetical protein [Anaerolineales bacterium]